MMVRNDTATRMHALTRPLLVCFAAAKLDPGGRAICSKLATTTRTHAFSALPLHQNALLNTKTDFRIARQKMQNP